MIRKCQPGTRCALYLAALTPLFCAAHVVPAQLSFRSAVTLALSNNPRVKLADDDVRHAQAVLDETHDVYIPRLSATAGLGDAYGITLSVPTIFTVGAQSLIFSYSQRNYIRAARADLEAAEDNLQEVQDQVVEETAISYISLAHAQQLHAVLAEQQVQAAALAKIVEERARAGLESPQAVRFSSRTLLQIRLQSLLNEDETANQIEHLTQLTGLRLQHLAALPESIPSVALAPADPAYREPPYLLSVEASARAKLERAFGDARFAWRPQIGFEAQYGRISPIVNVSSYYNIQGNYNTLSGGLVFQLPFLDAGRKARARQSAAEASHAFHDLVRLRGQHVEDALHLQHGLAELQIRLELAEIEQSIAQDQLKSTLIELQTGGYAGPPRPPQEEQNARMHERQTYIDLLNARLEVLRLNISLLRQMGKLKAWALSDPHPPALTTSRP